MMKKNLKYLLKPFALITLPVHIKVNRLRLKD